MHNAEYSMHNEQCTKGSAQCKLKNELFKMHNAH